MQESAHGIKVWRENYRLRPVSAPQPLEESARECRFNSSVQLGAELEREFSRLCEALQRIR